MLNHNNWDTMLSNKCTHGSEYILIQFTLVYINNHHRNICTCRCPCYTVYNKSINFYE